MEQSLLHLPPFPQDHNDDEHITRGALLVYAIYRTFNHVKHNQNHPTDNARIIDMASQYLIQGTSGHPGATKVLDSSFHHKQYSLNTNTHYNSHSTEWDNLINLPSEIDLCDFH